MAVPKRKTSKSRGAKRRTHQKISTPNISKCPQCGEPRQPHHACPSCGVYKGREVLKSAEN